MAEKSTNEQQRQAQGRQKQGQQESSGLARRGGSEWRGLALVPGDWFRMDPFSLMRRMSEEMDRVLGGSGSREGAKETAWVPAIEVAERDGNYIVRAELPGLKPQDVKVEVTDDALVLQGERKYEHEEDQGGVHRTERRYGQFYRVVPLPEGAKVDQVHARFNDGVLEITMPVTQEKSQTREIPVETSSTGSPNQKAA